MADLQDFIEDITTNKIKYCAVCFRTEKERKLVPPESVSNFIKYTALDQLSSSELVCVYCERQAEVSLKLYSTLRYARHVQRVLGALLGKGMMTAKSIAYLLPSKIRGQVSGPRSVKRNKLLSSLRQYQTYVQTDVLVVDASTNNESDSRNSEVFIIDDDEEDKNTQANAPRLVPIERLLQPQTTLDLKSLNTDNLSQILYQTKPPENPNAQYIVLPNDSKIVVANNDINLTSNLPVILPNGTMVLTQKTPSQILVPIIDNNIQNHNVAFNTDFVRVNTIDTVEEIILPDKRKIGEKVISSVVLAKMGEDNDVDQPNNVNQINDVCGLIGGVSQISGVSKIGGVNQMSDVSILSDKLRQINYVRQMCDPGQKDKGQMSDAGQTGDKICQITDLRSLQGNEIPPEPKKADKNIDWEDKIPMDVISFMESRGNASTQTHPPAPTPVTPVNHFPNKTVTPEFPVTTVPVISKSYTPRRNSRLLTINPFQISDSNTTNSPKDLNHSLELFEAKRRQGRKKRKTDEDDDVIIVS